MATLGRVTQLWKAMTEGKNFDRVLNKINFLSAGDGKCQAEMIISEEHTNSVGTLHGGLTSTIVDVVSGVALATHKNNPRVGVSVDLHITFLKGAPIGQHIIIDAKTNKAGRTLAFLDVLISEKATGKIIAKGSHTKYIADK